MRVIAGALKGRRLAAPGPGERSIRPTSDRAREALFSILQARPMGGFLDLFSGTGAMGVEAWSRGYRPVVCVDREPQALDCLRQNVLGTEIQVLKLDLSRPLRLPEQRFSIIFADPPYAESKGHFSRMASGLASRLDPEGLLVWETDRLTELPEAFGLLRVDDRAYGNVRFHLFVPGRE